MRIVEVYILVHQIRHAWRAAKCRSNCALKKNPESAKTPVLNKKTVECVREDFDSHRRGTRGQRLGHERACAALRDPRRAKACRKVLSHAEYRLDEGEEAVAEAVAKIATGGGDVVRSYRESLRGQRLILCVVPIDAVQANPSGATPQTCFINAWAVCQRQNWAISRTCDHFTCTAW